MANKLEILNSIKVHDYDTDSEDLYTVTALDNDENRTKIKQLGFDDEKINLFIDGEGHIELTNFAWNIANYAELGDGFNGWFKK